MTLWLTSDLHLGHTNILTYCPERPFEKIWEMDEFLIQTWNATVGPGDDVLVLGDVCMGNVNRSLQIISRLHGQTITLVAGNHDKPFRRNGTARLEWERRYLEAGFTSIIHGTTTVDLGFDTPALACHFPYRGDSRNHDRYLEHRPVDDGSTILLHGHSHGRARRNGRMIDVGVDAWGGRPVSVEEIATLITGPEDHVGPIDWPDSTPTPPDIEGLQLNHHCP